MKNCFLTKLWIALVTVATWAVPALVVSGQELSAEETASKQFWTDARVQTFKPGETLATYRWNPSGGVGPGGTLTLGAGFRERHFDVQIVAKVKSQQFFAKVSVIPRDNDTRTKGQKVEYDLTDLTPRTLEIARDEDGRIYQLSLVPTIKEVPQPRQFKASDLRLENWTFRSSPVIVNDQDYVGLFSFGQSPVGFCDIPGVAKVEFSLLRLKNALPIGTLEKGVINIKHENGTTLRISDVKNGSNVETLNGGPYRVWVRWLAPSQTVEEYRRSVKQQIELLKERVLHGDLTLPAGYLERLEEKSKLGRIDMTEFGVRGVEEGELVE